MRDCFIAFFVTAWGNFHHYLNMITLVLLPGMDGTGDLFAPLIEELAPNIDIQIVRYPVDSTEGYDRLTDFARQSIPIDRDYVLLGESFSGPIAISIAAEKSSRLKGLVLCCTFATNPQPRFRMLRAMLNFLPIRVASTSIAARGLLGRFATQSLCVSLQTAIRSVKPETLRARMRAIIDVDVTAALTKVTAPILYLKATQDWLVSGKSSDAIREIQPNINMVEIEGPHFLLQASAIQAARHVNKFLIDVQNAS